MKNDLFQDIADRLNKHRSPLDVEQEWRILQTAQQAQNRQVRRSVGLILLCLLFVGGMAYWIGSNSSTVGVPSPIECTAPAKEPVATKALIQARLMAETPVKPTDKKVTPLQTRLPDLTKKELRKRPAAQVQTREGEVEQTIALTTPQGEIAQIVSANPPSAGSNIPQLPKSDIPLLILDQQNQEMEMSVPNSGEVKRSGNTQLYFLAGIASTRQRLTAIDQVDEPYRQLRSEREQPLETYTYELGVNIELSRRSFLNLAAYHQIGFDRLDHDYELEKTFYFENVVLRRVTNRITGDVTEFRGDTAILGSQTIDLRQYNRYTSTSVGVALGHHVLGQSRFHLSVSGGLMYNVSLKTTGNTLAVEDPLSPLVPLSGYKRGHGLALQGAIHCDYDLNSSWQLSIQPSGFYGLSSGTSTGAVLDSRFYRFGIAAGLKFRL